MPWRNGGENSKIKRYCDLVVFKGIDSRHTKNVASLKRFVGVSNGDTSSIFQASTHIIRVKIIDDRESFYELTATIPLKMTAVLFQWL